MFKTIKQLLENASQIDLFITGNGDMLTVTVVPKAKDGNVAALKAPLSLTATADELDAGFVEALTTFAGVRKSLAEQVAQTTSILDAEKKAQAAKAVKSAKKTGATPADNVSDALGDDGNDDDATGNESPAPSSSSAPVAAPAAPAAAQTTENAGDEFDLAKLLEGGL